MQKLNFAGRLLTRNPIFVFTLRLCHFILPPKTLPCKIPVYSLSQKAEKIRLNSRYEYNAAYIRVHEIHVKVNIDFIFRPATQKDSWYMTNVIFTHNDPSTNN